ncbi:MAG: hypothetical protein ABS49_06255 [Erythrobacter sp. SCN 62-14]|nr:MAG: hypothetical protein ABS49_06255 [Erythrobacter sp. SCN 62-14]
MFIGHFAPAFIAAAVSPHSPKLGTLFVAAQLVDWAFFSLALVGVEKMRIDPAASVMVPFDLYHMPYTHSLAGTFVFAAVFVGIVTLWQRNPLGGGLAGLVVLSHWVLDWLVHPADLTLAGAPPKHGLGLWDYPWAAMPLELALIGGAFAFYMSRTRGPIGPPVVLMMVMLLLQAVNWFAPHPAEMSAAIPLQAFAAFGLITALGAWVSTNRGIKVRRGLAWSDR